MINVFADKHLHRITDYLTDNVNFRLFDPAAGIPEIPSNTQALLIRTVTKINVQTCPSLPSSLEFIGTGSAGTDHVDQQYLGENNIRFANAAGCNARSVAEYVAVGLLLWAEEHDKHLHEHTVGIIGVGHTGSAVNKLLNQLGIHTILYDPPRETRDADFKSASLEEVLQADILSFHTPLTHQSDHPTFHWLDEAKLNDQSFELIINASRGGVVDEEVLHYAFDNNRVGNFILDVWENEPAFYDDTARRAFIKTPHIAGYSRQAKERATRMIVQAMKEHFAENFALPDMKTTAATNQPSPETFWSLTDALTYYHPIRDYETRFKMLIGRSDEAKANGFNRIRTGHPLRDEFTHSNISSSTRDTFTFLEKLFE